MANYTFVLCPTKYRAGATWHIISYYADQTFCNLRRPVDPEWPRSTVAVDVWETGIRLCDKCDRLSYRNAGKFLNAIPDSYEATTAGDLRPGDRVRWYGADRAVLTRRVTAADYRGTNGRMWKRARYGFRLEGWPNELDLLAATRLLRSNRGRRLTDPSEPARTAI